MQGIEDSLCSRLAVGGLLLLALFISSSASSELQVSSVHQLYKEFIRKPPLPLPFLRATRVRALNSVSLEFSAPVVTLIGTSGSGKSTLAKLICGLETPSSGKIERRCGGRGAYIDPLFYLSYDTAKTASELLDATSTPAAVLNLRKQIGVPDLRVDSLLTSERRAFEVLLAIARATEVSPPLLVLDEYLDKDLTGTLRLFKETMQLMNAELGLQTFIVTHSKSVVGVFNEDVVALSGGRVFSRSFNGALMPYPAELDFI